ncbi:iron-containing redox enzyme family protein [Nocardioides marmotae]|uniref:iron-containing redox enzyme family protein n=1 Tax=Nocardioides marmotae TaxID=2663857 RepID=UPI0012B5AE06|nr:iron-containing redox enzyme family protein [Nocardioides marmotae]MBC9734782.1 iron-containing redox enzyme family protein [Nocardioides marmotae]MTB85883.1 iron-containing redox enzyme family protein [Nocardioides marmotae]
MRLPKARGTLSERLFSALREEPGTPVSVEASVADDAEDRAIALWASYELHYRGFEDVDDRWEWSPGVLRVRAALEEALEGELRARYAEHRPERAGDLAKDLFDYIAGHDGPSMSRYVQTEATETQVMELLRQKSVYHLKEADPSAWVVPRLPTGPKAALMELQFDEYGDGNPARLHQHLFERGLEAAGLRSEYGAYVDEATVPVLEANNVQSFLGLHRRMRAAAMGHLAAFEATSSIPSRRMAQGLERLGFPEEIVEYYREHVEADAVHEQLAVRDICAPLVELEPALADDVFLGAYACLDTEDRQARDLLEKWGVEA